VRGCQTSFPASTLASLSLFPASSPDLGRYSVLIVTTSLLTYYGHCSLFKTFSLLFSPLLLSAKNPLLLAMTSLASVWFAPFPYSSILGLSRWCRVNCSRHDISLHIDRGSMQMVEHQMIYSPEKRKKNGHVTKYYQSLPQTFGKQR
jgi:hypothetical protein